jgi:hypothetical protein
VELSVVIKVTRMIRIYHPNDPNTKIIIRMPFVYWGRVNKMLKDYNHDLVHALSEKNDALWRYKNHYLKASVGCKSCTKMWKTLEADDSRHVAMLIAEIKRHISEGRFS